MYKLEIAVLIFNMLLVALTCYMCINNSMWWILLLVLINSVEHVNKTGGD
jgi:hypothetical protein